MCPCAGRGDELKEEWLILFILLEIMIIPFSINSQRQTKSSSAKVIRQSGFDCNPTALTHE